ncbi:hypothetical protein CMV_020540 [Castanea mollissima]|uniref:Uncharacterized protein n=1 Tax=Castanea mollissima TaxID=60419 RepID=A0A8J4QL93_9ROSI|nr:hypothetical protein CMV_020540 [Castanea mollissima]
MATGHDDRHCQSGVSNTDEPQQYGEWLRARGGNKGGSLRNGPTNASAMPNDNQNSEERRQNAVLRMEIDRSQKGIEQNQEAGKFPEKRNGDVSLIDVIADGDGNFREKDFQIQSQRNKEDTDRQENVGTHERKEKEGWRESYVVIGHEKSVDSNDWDPQVAKRAEQKKECQEVTSPIKKQNGPNDEAEMIKEKEMAQAKKGRLQKLARGQQQNKAEETGTTESVVGTKRRLLEEENKEDGGKKRFCGGEFFPSVSTAVAARQQRREP